eukprot:1406917-Prymnesium_polylepis.2
MDVDAGADVLHGLAHLEGGGGARVLDHLQPAEDVALGVVDRLAVLHRQDLRELIGVLSDQRLQPEHDARAVGDGGVGPAGEGGLGRRDRLVHLRGAIDDNAREDCGQGHIFFCAQCVADVRIDSSRAHLAFRRDRRVCEHSLRRRAEHAHEIGRFGLDKLAVDEQRHLERRGLLFQDGGGGVRVRARGGDARGASDGGTNRHHRKPRVVCNRDCQACACVASSDVLSLCKPRCKTSAPVLVHAA